MASALATILQILELNRLSNKCSNKVKQFRLYIHGAPKLRTPDLYRFSLFIVYVYVHAVQEYIYIHADLWEI